MRVTTRLWTVLALVLLVVPGRAEEAKPKVVREDWEAAYFEGTKAGYFHTLVTETERDGKKLYTTQQTMSLKIRRNDKVVEMKFAQGFDETADAKLVGVSLTIFTGKGELAAVGRVEGDKLIITGDGGRELKRLPWDPAAFGMYGQIRVCKEKNVKPGDKFSFVHFEFSLEKACKINVAVKPPEETDLLEVAKDDPKAKAQRVKRSLMRIDVQPEPVQIGDAPVSLPGTIIWLDSDFNWARREWQAPGLGRITTYRTTKAVATEEGTAPELLPDILLTTLIPLDKAIARPYDGKEVTFRITMTGAGDPKTTFVRDFRQWAAEEKDRSFELRVRAQRQPAILDKPEPVGDEHRQANRFLDSNDEVIRALTARAVAGAADPLTKARRIEKWVHDNMKGTSDIVFATAAQVARDLKGDCRQHAMLTAAMFRAAGLPSRTAVGLVYSENAMKKPVLAFHMWAEAYVGDQWLGFDAVLGLGGIGPTHLKVSDSSWHNAHTLAPLLSVLRVLDRIKVEVVSAR